MQYKQFELLSNDITNLSTKLEFIVYFNLLSNDSVCCLFHAFQNLVNDRYEIANSLNKISLVVKRTPTFFNLISTQPNQRCFLIIWFITKMKTIFMEWIIPFDKLTVYINISIYCNWSCGIINPLHPNISTHVLHTLLYTFPLVLTRRIYFTITAS